MKLLVIAEAGAARRTLLKLFAGTEHRLECLAPDEITRPAAGEWDMVLLDGSASNEKMRTRLYEAARRLRGSLPRTPVLVFSAMGPDAARYTRPSGCRISTTGNGIWRMHCRLKELACSETEALLREALAHEAPEPMVFEYRG